MRNYISYPPKIHLMQLALHQVKLRLDKLARFLFPSFFFHLPNFSLMKSTPYSAWSKTISGANFKSWLAGGPSTWRSKMRRSPSSPQIHQKYIYMWNNSYRIPTERWQKTSDFTKGKKIPMYPVGQKKKEKQRQKNRDGTCTSAREL